MKNTKETGRLSDDIKEEHNKLLEADLVIFQFPMYWSSVPGIMKGWIDRVLTQGFAFSLQNMYDNGIFRDKKALLSFTTGGPESMYLPDGIKGDINIMLYPLQVKRAVFTYLVVYPWSSGCATSGGGSLLEHLREREEQPLSFAPTELFDLTFQGGFRLRPEVKEARAVQPYGLTPGHHLGKRLPPDNQTKPAPRD
uniref:NAD(P)H dehydrogenase, quinone 1 n=1 Tax=Astyanax mexicanus TaxID=7994 RepID=A0A8B9RHA3_ASTMX